MTTKATVFVTIGFMMALGAVSPAHAQTEEVEEIVDEVTKLFCISWFSENDSQMSAAGPIGIWSKNPGGQHAVGVGIANSGSSFLVVAVGSSSEACPPPEEQAMNDAVSFWTTEVIAGAWDLIFGQQP